MIPRSLIATIFPPDLPESNVESLPTVLLKPGHADRVIAGHPWIYAGSVLRLTMPAADGALVQIKDHRQRFLGVGFYNSKSKIQVRVIAPERVEVDGGFFVVNAESDFLSGLIVDKYSDVLVVQISSLCMDQRKAMIVEALQRIFSP